MNRADIHLVWDELADFGADRDAEAAAHLMKFLCERGGAWNATWAGGTRLDNAIEDDPLKGWRISAIQALYPIAPFPDEGHFWEVVKPWEKRVIDPSYLLPIRGLGTFRTYSLRRDLPEAWFDSPFYHRHYGRVGTVDGVWVGFPLNEDCESHFAFYGREPLLIFTGGRRSEAMLATWENVDLDRGILTVPRAKNGRTRHIPLSPVAVAILQRQLDRRQADNPHVFPSHVQPGKPLEGLRGVWARAKKAAGLAPDLRVHDLRHSFASALANAGIPLNEIGALLGHAQLSTTTRYAHHSPQRLIATATTASRAWDLLPEPTAAEAAFRNS